MSAIVHRKNSKNLQNKKKNAPAEKILLKII